MDPSGSQFFSTLEPLSKEQQRAIKAVGGGNKRAQGGSQAAAQPTGASAPGEGPPAGPRGGTAVALCLLPIHASEQSGQGVPGATLYFLPLAAGVWGGLEVDDAAAARGRDISQQLLASSQCDAIVAFDMQGGDAAAGRLCICPLVQLP